MTLWGYARVSTSDQSPDAQINALRMAGVDDEHLVVEHASGVRTDRPGLEELLEKIQPDDTLMVWKLDRLGRSLPHLVQVVNDLGQKGAQFCSLTESAMDTTSPQGRLLFGIMGSLAQFERDLITERTKAGLAAAKAKGHHGGRPATISPQQAETLRYLIGGQGYSVTAAAKSVGVSRSAASRFLNGKLSTVKLPETPSLLSRDNDPGHIDI